MGQKLKWQNENEALGHDGSRYFLEEIKISGESEPVFNITKTCKNARHRYHSDLFGDNGAAQARQYYNRAEAVKECELDYEKSAAPGQIEWFYGSGRKTSPGKFNPVSELTAYGYNPHTGAEYRIYSDADYPEIFTRKNFEDPQLYYLAKIDKNGDYSLHPGAGYYATSADCPQLAQQDYITEKAPGNNLTR